MRHRRRVQAVALPIDDLAVAEPSHYPFGYATFEPMLNLFKGILIATALLYAVWTAVRALMSGGQEVAAIGGIIYAAIAVSGGIALVVVLRKLGERSGSPIVQLDAQNAVIDTMISGAVGVAFVATLIIQSTPGCRRGLPTPIR